ncbi:MAG TPA: tetratricopeptide repeat protein [Rhodanobacteraceae bacterium]|nr:tetratricopeptide repeat protein [Rhodanobacteraceae bacterium]
MRFLFGRRSASTDATPQPEPSDETPDALIAEGNRVEDAGDAAAALALYERAIAIAPDSWRAELNAGNALGLLGQATDAVARYRRSVGLNPDAAGAHLNLGNGLIAIGAFAEAATSYRAAARLRADWPEAWFGLGCALERIPAFDEAGEAYEKALVLDPTHAKAAANLAALRMRAGDARGARRIVESARKLRPLDVPLLIAQADIEKQLGECEAAADAYRAALAVTPDDLALRSSYLFTLNFCADIDAATLLAEHREYGRRLASGIARLPTPAHPTPHRRLRIGYVSPDFRRHSVSCFIEPVLRHHDRSVVEVYCYYNHDTRDDVTERLEQLADRWCDIVDFDDAAAARRIADDGIDILVDLAGHTTGGRLGVFAHKPAPVQVTWLGYLCTTGVSAIDYRLCDAHTDPARIAESWQTEKPLRLPNAQWCYQPQVPLPEPSALPRIANGFWTFGSFNQSSKLNTALIETWARLLGAIPGSRLRIVGVSHAPLEEKIRAIFAAGRIEADRLDVVGRVAIEDYFPQYRDVDIALDSLPYNGATTTCDALLMGIPVATVAGDRSIARGGVSLLRTVGLDAWIAESTDELTPIVQSQIHDVSRIAALRETLPATMRASALMDGQRFARNLEAAFRIAWNDSMPR